MIESFESKELKFLKGDYVCRQSGKLYYYFSKRKLEEGEEKIMIRVNYTCVIVRFKNGWVLDNRYDINNVVGIEQSLLYDFYHLLFKLMKSSQECIVFEDFPGLIKYLSISKKYKIPLLNIKVRCYNDLLNIIEEVII